MVFRPGEPKHKRSRRYHVNKATINTGKEKWQVMGEKAYRIFKSNLTSSHAALVLFVCALESSSNCA